MMPVPVRLAGGLALIRINRRRMSAGCRASDPLRRRRALRQRIVGSGNLRDGLNLG